MPVNTFNERIEILNTTAIGLTDVLEKVKRDLPNCNADTCLTAINYNSILDLKEHFPSLKNIFITSGGRGPIRNINNNRNVGTWLKSSVINHELNGFNRQGFVKKISIDKIEFNLIYLHSPSPQSNVSIQGVLNNHNNFGIQGLNIADFRRIQWGYFLKTLHLGKYENPTINEIINLVNNNEELFLFFNN